MSLQPLLSASPVIQLHTALAFLALFLGVAQFCLPKGNHRHRALGYVWAALMMLVALSSFFIHTIRMIGPFSPIHLLSILTLVAVPATILDARRGNIAKHRKGMIMLFWLALVGAGVFTFLPRRLMGQIVFGTG